MRGRDQRGGFQLGSVTAVPSPGIGDDTITTAEVVAGLDEHELLEAFERVKGEDGLLGLDGFRVSNA